MRIRNVEGGIRPNLGAALEQGLEGRRSGRTGQTFLHWGLCERTSGAKWIALGSREQHCLGGSQSTKREVESLQVVL